ncbi:MAG: hypothetical protein CVV64_17870 [Candidatus Wallbacteria bacterium HGW-Wallbacteria-1]|jgi:hypothetical protein|uniref:Uncharacterized protein n=1 Tax=Candidatus Wallbacteria bacterium HGW-Wallbacteria-1 TaxID=2013854 RepID=A0A2N1PJZ4_9BACT|nr:MAG: hypothetical protein CVV64_17870 [Candidatus Wallbacteria bacterium HGW-Wallbacteria-1]
MGAEAAHKAHKAHKAGIMIFGLSILILMFSFSVHASGRPSPDKVCISNLRTLDSAIEMYAMDRNASGPLFSEGISVEIGGEVLSKLEKAGMGTIIRRIPDECHYTLHWQNPSGAGTGAGTGTGTGNSGYHYSKCSRHGTVTSFTKVSENANNREAFRLTYVKISLLSLFVAFLMMLRIRRMIGGYQSGDWIQGLAVLWPMTCFLICFFITFFSTYSRGQSGLRQAYWSNLEYLMVGSALVLTISVIAGALRRSVFMSLCRRELKWVLLTLLFSIFLLKRGGDLAIGLLLIAPVMFISTIMGVFAMAKESVKPSVRAGSSGSAISSAASALPSAISGEGVRAGELLRISNSERLLLVAGKSVGKSAVRSAGSSEEPKPGKLIIAAAGLLTLLFMYFALLMAGRFINGNEVGIQSSVARSRLENCKASMNRIKAICEPLRNAVRAGRVMDRIELTSYDRNQKIDMIIPLSRENMDRAGVLSDEPRLEEMKILDEKCFEGGKYEAVFLHDRNIRIKCSVHGRIDSAFMRVPCQMPLNPDEAKKANTLFVMALAVTFFPWLAALILGLITRKSRWIRWNLLKIPAGGEIGPGESRGMGIFGVLKQEWPCSLMLLAAGLAMSMLNARFMLETIRNLDPVLLSLIAMIALLFVPPSQGAPSFFPACRSVVFWFVLALLICLFASPYMGMDVNVLGFGAAGLICMVIVGACVVELARKIYQKY